MTCKSCGEERKVESKGMCHRCRAREWRKENPDKQEEIRKRYYEKHKKEIAEKRKRWRRKNRERYNELMRKYNRTHKEQVKERQKRWRSKNKGKVKEKLERLHKNIVCKILKDHAEKLKDDPERLSTEYIRKMSSINFECEDNIKE